jgi:hypothetical protein
MNILNPKKYLVNGFTQRNEYKVATYNNTNTQASDLLNAQLSKTSKAKMESRRLLDKKNTRSSSNDADDKKFYLKRVFILENPMDKLPSLPQRTINAELNLKASQWKYELTVMKLLDRPPLNLIIKRNRRLQFKSNRVNSSALGNASMNINCLKPIITKKEVVEHALSIPMKHRMLKQPISSLNNTEHFTVIRYIQHSLAYHQVTIQSS